jgi:hypothetical protein
MDMAHTQRTVVSKKVRRMFGLDLDAWNTVMVSFLGVAAIAAVVVGVSTAIIIKLQKQAELESSERIASLIVQGDQLRKDTADANARAAQANLSLQRLTVPRFLDPEPFRSALVGVLPPSAVEILYVEDCADCFIFANMVVALLSDLQWPCSVSALRKRYSAPDWMAGLPATMQQPESVS